MHVLVIEDDSNDFELLRQRLYRSDPSIILTRVSCIANAIEAISQHSFDVIISDLELPDSIGLGTIHRIRKHAADLPIVVFSGNNDIDQAMEAVRQGAHDYITKEPPTGELMTRCLKYAIQRSKWQVQQREHLQEAWLLQQAEQLANEKIKRRDDFLAMVSHELRTPVAAIIAAVELMDILPEEADSTKPRQVIRRQCKQVTALLEQLLELCRLRQDKFELEMAPVNIENSVQEAIDGVQGKLSRKKHVVEIACDDPMATVCVDPIRFHQVLVNLLGNAAKFTPKKGRIEIEVENANSLVSIRVRDNGVGIQDSDIDRVFDPFVQVAPRKDSLKKTKNTGIGIGLALTKKLVEMQGGTIAVRSSDEGTEFTLEFPNVCEPVEEPCEQTSSESPICQLNVVVVEDDDDARMMLEMVFQLHGCNVTSACCGEEGVALVAETKPDVVFMDIGLPDISGYEVARRLRMQEPSTPYLIAVTGYGQPDDIRRSEEAGINEHLIKPVRTELLVNKLKDVAQRVAK